MQRFSSSPLEMLSSNISKGRCWMVGAAFNLQQRCCFNLLIMDIIAIVDLVCPDLFSLITHKTKTCKASFSSGSWHHLLDWFYGMNTVNKLCWTTETLIHKVRYRQETHEKKRNFAVQGVRDNFERLCSISINTRNLNFKGVLKLYIFPQDGKNCETLQTLGSYQTWSYVPSVFRRTLWILEVFSTSWSIAKASGLSEKWSTLT